MTKPSLILRFNGTSKLIEIVDIHINKMLKVLHCSDSTLFEDLDKLVRNGTITFDYLLGNRIRDINDIEMDKRLPAWKPGDRIAPHLLEANTSEFKIGDIVIIIGYASHNPKWKIICFDDASGDNMAIVEHNNQTEAVHLSEITLAPEKAPPAPIHHARFKEGNKVYIGQTPYTFNGMHDMNTARLITARGEHVKEPIEKVYIPEPEEEHTGGSSSYYMTYVTDPTTLNHPYAAECNDIIESLQMTYAEANMFKAVWRNAASRQGHKKKGNNGLYDAEKCVFFAARMLIAEQEASN